MPFVLPKWFVIVAMLVCSPTLLFAAPIFQAETDGAKVVLTDEPCAIAAVTNLKFRATWEEKGKTFEGCWMPRPDMGVVVAYWSDKTAVAIPIQIFAKVAGI